MSIEAAAAQLIKQGGLQSTSKTPALPTGYNPTLAQQMWQAISGNVITPPGTKDLTSVNISSSTPSPGAPAYVTSPRLPAYNIVGPQNVNNYNTGYTSTALRAPIAAGSGSGSNIWTSSSKTNIPINNPANPNYQNYMNMLQQMGLPQYGVTQNYYAPVNMPPIEPFVRHTEGGGAPGKLPEFQHYERPEWNDVDPAPPVEFTPPPPAYQRDVAKYNKLLGI